MSKISPCIWFAHDGEEAANFYVGLFPDARVDRVTRSPVDNPGGKVGDVLMVEFTLGGQSFQALNGGTPGEFTQSLSLSVDCEDQAEVDRIWDGFLARGGEEIACGWIKDPWGVQWQIVPAAMQRYLVDPDRAKAKRAMEAMFTMKRIDAAAIERAAEG